MIEFFLDNPKVIWAIMSIIAVIFAVVAMVRFHLSDSYSKFNIIEILSIDQTTGNPSDSKLRLNIAFVIMTWAFVYITMQDKLTEWYVIAYATAWVTDRFLTRYISSTAKDK